MLCSTLNSTILLSKAEYGPILPLLEHVFGNGTVSFITVSDNMAAVPDMIRQWVGGHYTVLGTDGFGCLDTLEAQCRFFEIDGAAVDLVALSSLVRDGSIDASVYEKAANNSAFQQKVKISLKCNYSSKPLGVRQLNTGWKS